MIKRCLFVAWAFCVPMFSVCADELSDAMSLYQSAQTICVGVSDDISKISGVAKVNTAGNAVGAVSAGGALVVGIKKASVDEELAKLEAEAKSILGVMCKDNNCEAEVIEKMSDKDFIERVREPLVKLSEVGVKMEQTSKKLGNWRTGLMAGSAATNIASAIVAGINKNQSDLIQRIQACNMAVAQLAPYKSRLINSGVNPLENPIVNKIDNVATWCKPIDVTEIEKIEKRMAVSMGTSIGGAVVGVAGVATSAMANSDKVRDDDTESGMKKEKNLNAASNVLAGVNVATGAVGAGVNISMISIAKKLIKQAQTCEEAF